MTQAAGTTTTIAAIATPPGRGGVGIVRVSGPKTRAIAHALLHKLPEPRYATLTRFYDDNNGLIDEGLALFFPAPHSFTGEDVLELHAHGGSVTLDMLLRAALHAGATAAGPGEFSQRAFLNGKLDLAQAEAIADLIESSSESAARSALRSLQGVFSQRVHAIVEALIQARVFVESAIDFPEEEIDFLADDALTVRIADIENQIDALLQATRQGCLMREGATVVLAGPPNAGKSSLLNAFTQREAAIVSPIPGTTRDALREHVQIDGLPLLMIDTAGLRDTADVVESEGVRRARAALAQADHALVVVDDASRDEIASVLREVPAGLGYTLVRNKIDLTQRAPGLASAENDRVEIAVSCKTGAGLDALAARLRSVMGFAPAGEGLFTARRRHLDAIARARAHVQQGRRQLAQTRAGELLAEELRQAQQALGEITGEYSSDDLLGEIFASFCIGK